MIQAGDIRTFIRDRRLYLVIRMMKRASGWLIRIMCRTIIMP